MTQGMDILASYASRIAPALPAYALCLVLLPRVAAGLRMAIYIAVFVLVRDAMTPTGLWNFDDLRISFFNDPFVLCAIGMSTICGVVLLVLAERDMRPLLTWRKGPLVEGGAVGIGAGIVVGAAALGASALIAAPSASGPMPLFWDFAPAWVFGLVILAYGGNLLEEVLFRGYLQGWLERVVSPLRSALVSGLLFAACHAFLAITVTDGGWPILAFTALEGLACGLVRLRYGIWAATLTHGTAIMLLSMPMQA